MFVTETWISNVGKMRAMVQPMRFKIIQTLRAAGRPMYIEEIAERIEEERKYVAYHLGILRGKSLAKMERGRTLYPLPIHLRNVSYHELTPEVDRIFQWFSQII